ncbi:MAG: immunity 52 family protein [Chloroflexi bacterium]|nr:immunity 52 family protein [Chloroflexota bacterium]
MKTYSCVIWSFEPQSIGMFDNVFKNKTVSKLVFPSKMYLGKNKTEEKFLFNSGEFSSALIPKEDISNETGRIPLYLYPENGLQFSASALPSNSLGPSVLVIGFTAKHIQDSVCTLDDVVTLLKEGVFGMAIGQAYLCDDHLIEIPEPNGGVSFLRTKTYKRPAKGSYRLELDWLTYFGAEYLDMIGRKRFDKLTTCFSKEEVNNGIMIVLQEEPFDNTNPEHLKRKEQAERELGFEELLKK